MSVQPQTSWPIPEETERVARAAFPNGNVYLRLRDELGGTRSLPGCWPPVGSLPSLLADWR